MTTEKIWKGVYREPLKGGGFSPIYRVLRVVPVDVRDRIGRSSWDQTLDTDSASVARARAIDLHKRWDAEIKAARLAAIHPPLDIAHVRRRLEAWERYHQLVDVARDPDPGLTRHDIRPPPWRRDYSSPLNLTAETPPSVAERIALVSAARRSKRWDTIPAFSELIASAVKTAELEIDPTHPQWPEVCEIFAACLLNAVTTAETKRLALAHEALSRTLSRAPQASILPALEAQAQAEHITVRRLIEAYRSDREGRFGRESTGRKYGHIFRALEEVVGADTPITILKREDCRRVRAVLARLPSNASKRFRGLTMVEAIASADASEDEIPRLAPNTLNSYCSNLTALLNFAVQEEWIARNPAAGLVDLDMPAVRRRGFTASELAVVFGGLAEERREKSWRWWLPVLALFTGARANELCQLRPGDVRDQDGIAFLAISRFDASGRRDAEKRLKTATSERVVPLHQQVIESGFADFAASRADSGMLFDLPNSVKDSRSHELSKWFARHLDNLKMTDPSLVFHSFRHGFKDAADDARIAASDRNYMGGWATAGVAERYGRGGNIPRLKDEIDRISFGSFRL